MTASSELSLADVLARVHLAVRDARALSTSKGQSLHSLALYPLNTLQETTMSSLVPNEGPTVSHIIHPNPKP